MLATPGRSQLCYKVAVQQRVLGEKENGEQSERESAQHSAGRRKSESREHKSDALGKAAKPADEVWGAGSAVQAVQRPALGQAGLHQREELLKPQVRAQLPKPNVHRCWCSPRLPVAAAVHG
jgi:hypothetical protein